MADETKPPIRIYAEAMSATHTKIISPHPNYLETVSRAAGYQAVKWLAWKLVVHDGETGAWEVHRRPEPLEHARITVWIGDDIAKLAENGLSAGKLIS